MSYLPAMTHSNGANEKLFSLSYVSSAVIELDGSATLELLTTCRSRNAARGITGMLLYKDGDFMQVLEGPQDEVERAFASIKRDPRHLGIIVLWKKPIEERAFPNWTMAFRHIDPAVAGSVEGFSPFLRLSFLDAQFRANPDMSYQLLLSFKETMRM